jgi:hypothetical protein
MVVGYLNITQIITGKKPCVLGEASTQIPLDKKGPHRPDLSFLLDISSVQLKSPITKMKERGPLNV